MESPVKTDFRLTRRSTTIGGVDIAAGTPVMLLNGAANRDPRRFECPAEFRIDRENVQGHIAFGRGAHSCPGRPARPRRGSREPGADPRPDAQHPVVRGAPRSGRRAPLRVRADVDPAWSHVRPSRVRPAVATRPISEPRRRRHRWCVGHRSRCRQAVRRRRASGGDLRPQRCGGRARPPRRSRPPAARRSPPTSTWPTGPRSMPDSSACVPNSARSRSS